MMLFRLWERVDRIAQVDTQVKGVLFDWLCLLVSKDGYAIYQKGSLLHLGKVKRNNKSALRIEPIQGLQTANLNKARDNADNLIRSMENAKP